MLTRYDFRIYAHIGSMCSGCPQKIYFITGERSAAPHELRSAHPNTAESGRGQMATQKLNPLFTSIRIILKLYVVVNY